MQTDRLYPFTTGGAAWNGVPAMIEAGLRRWRACRRLLEWESRGWLRSNRPMRWPTRTGSFHPAPIGGPRPR